MGMGRMGFDSLGIRQYVGSASTDKTSSFDKLVSQMTSVEKIEAAMRLSLGSMSEALANQLDALFSPESIAIITGTLVLWAGSHLIGVGEFIDVILLVSGFFLLGWSAVQGAQSLSDFVTISINANSEADLKRAARSFADGVTTLGIDIVTGLLLRRSAGAVAKRGIPQYRPMPNVGRPMPGPPRIRRPWTLPSGDLGVTDSFGNIWVIRNQTLEEQRLTLYHEWVHSMLSPRVGPFRVLRAQISMSGYERSVLLKYLEEALAECYAQLRVRGLADAISAIAFPVRARYMTISDLVTEGVAIGNIILGGRTFTVTISQGRGPDAGADSAVPDPAETIIVGP